jgi:hypothetical protein
MIRFHSRVAILGAALALTGCSFASETLWPSLNPPDPAGGSQSASQRADARNRNVPPAPPAPAPPPSLGQSAFVPSVTPGQATGTLVGQKVEGIRAELQRLLTQIARQNQQLLNVRNQTIQNSQTYHGTIAAINARLQVGTTPGNPTLVNQWNSAQAALARIDSDISQLHALANEVAGTSTLSTYLLDTTRATYGLTGAVDEDHRQLAILEDEVSRTLVLIDRLLNEINDDIQRQTAYLGGTRAGLTTLSLAIKNGELIGGTLTPRSFQGVSPAAGPRQATAANVAVAPPPAVPVEPVMSTPSAAAPNRPLVVIRFDRPNVTYEQALYTAVSRALERRPEATFDLVAVTPNRGTSGEAAVASTSSRRNAESVLRSLSEMGLPLDRVRLSATTSTVAAANEVHVYVR